MANFSLRVGGANENFRDFFRRFTLDLRVFDASAEGTSENFTEFCTETTYDVILFKFQGGEQLR